MATRWSLFAGVAVTVLLILVALARLSAEAVPSDSQSALDERQHSRSTRTPNGGTVDRDEFERFDPEAQDSERDARNLGDLGSMSTATLLVNVALSQGLLGLLLVFGAWYAEIPLSAFGVVVGDSWNLGLPALAIGLGFGVALYVANELLGVAVDDLGIDFTEELREALAPESLGGWLVLMVVVLPTIAAFEEILFRAALVGVLSAGFAVSPWLLAALSSVAFAVGHGMQGPGGIVVTGLLGFVLAAAFIVSGSLLVVIVAHYVVNALEFVVHEGLGWEPFDKSGG